MGRASIFSAGAAAYPQSAGGCAVVTGSLARPGRYTAVVTKTPTLYLVSPARDASRPYSASIFGGMWESSALSGSMCRSPRREAGWWRRLLVQCIYIPLEPPREDADGEVQAAEGRVVQHDHEIHPLVEAPISGATTN